ncbi:MAG: HK97 family phage prohead protease [Chloroflexi bacterium]|nr:HK97 family phage prohead protease [Chloroflexota bacterium]
MVAFGKASPPEGKRSSQWSAPGRRETKQSMAFTTHIDPAQGIVEAIVSVFGVLDSGGDIIKAGAFKRTIAERGDRVQVLDSHRADSVLRVVGKMLAIREVGRDDLPDEVLARHPEATGGLLTRTQYLLDTPEGAGVFKRIAAGAVSEYSIGYDALRTTFVAAQRPDGTPTQARQILEVRLWEYSPVIWGMNPATATVGVKAAAHLDDAAVRESMRAEVTGLLDEVEAALRVWQGETE